MAARIDPDTKTGHMNNWLQFLERQGASLDPGTGAAAFGSALPAGGSFVAPLTDLGHIALTGDDAAAFLHGQITNDVEHLDTATVRLAGYCTPTGRLLATFLMWRTADAILLQLPREIQPPIQKRLQMYVLRAKAKLADVSDTLVAIGLAGRDAEALLSRLFPALPAAPWTRAEGERGALLRLPDAAGQPRWQWIGTPDEAERLWPEFAAVLPVAGSAAWRLAEIEAGIAQVRKATQEQFVPQMINLELVGGVNFRKGCYPGQEIVARSQYLGKLKRRTMLADVEGDAAAGMEIFSVADPEQPCGMVVDAVRRPDGAASLLAELKTAAIDDGEIRLGSADGPALRFRPLPYELKDPA